MIAIVDYGAGNLASVTNAFAAIGVSAAVTRSPADVRAAKAVVVPGVGHFDATAAIENAMRQALLESARSARILGICLGLQFLFDGSEEAPARAGLGLLRGRCMPLRARADAKVPHVGWNGVEGLRPSRLLDGVANAAFYFTHSYAAPVTSACVARTEYGMPFAAAVEAGNVFGTQFHPEKSGDAGLQVLRNFVDAA